MRYKITLDVNVDAPLEDNYVGDVIRLLKKKLPTYIQLLDWSIEKMILEELSNKHGLNLKFLQAVARVESSGQPFREYEELGNYPTIRFEPNKFNKYKRPQVEPMPYTNNGKGFSSKSSETGPSAYLEALKRDRDAAILSTSYGQYQIMGFNHKGLGYNTPEGFLGAMMTEEGQTEAFVRFIMNNKYLRTAAEKSNPAQGDFYQFAKSYNGPSNAEAYSKKIQKAYEALS